MNSARESAGAGGRGGAGWVWLLMFDAPRLAARPAQLTLSAILVLISAMLLRVDGLWRADPPWLGGLIADEARVHTRAFASSLRSIDPIGACESILTLVLRVPREVALERPWAVLAAGVPLVACWMVFGGAISRLAALRLGRAEVAPWADGAGFALRRAASLILAGLGPIIAAALIAGVLALAGGALFNVPVLDDVGAVLYGLMLLGGFIAVMIAVCTALGFPLFAPGLACEGTDAIDATQRAFAYVVTRPLRLLGVYVLLAAMIAILGFILSELGGAIVAFTEWSAGLLVGDQGRAALSGEPVGLEGTRRVAAEIIATWHVVVALAVASYGVSLFFCGSTAAYLLLRHAADGEDPSEIWMPGETGGVREDAAAAPDEVED